MQPASCRFGKKGRDPPPENLYNDLTGGMPMKEQILAVQRMQEYIEAHLSEEIGSFAPMSG